MTLFNNIEKHVEEVTGLTVEQIRRFSPEKLRAYLEHKNNKKFSFTSEFPTVGRGNILRDGIEGTTEINKEIDAILT